MDKKAPSLLNSFQYLLSLCYIAQGNLVLLTLLSRKLNTSIMVPSQQKSAQLSNKTRPCYITQVALKQMNLLPKASKCWNLQAYTTMPSCKKSFSGDRAQQGSPGWSTTHYAYQVCLKLKEPMPLSPKYGDQRCVLPHPAQIILINVNILGQRVTGWLSVCILKQELKTSAYLRIKF